MAIMSMGQTLRYCFASCELTIIHDCLGLVRHLICLIRGTIDFVRELVDARACEARR